MYKRQSVGVTLLCLFAPVPIMRLYSGEEEVVRAAASYLSLAAFSYVPYAVSNNYMMNLRAVEQVKVSTAIYATSFFKMCIRDRTHSVWANMAVSAVCSLRLSVRDERISPQRVIYFIRASSALKGYSSIGGISFLF